MDSDSPSLTLTSTELRGVTAALLDLIEAELGTTITLDADHYWQVDGRSAFDLSTTPTIVVGQLADDVESVRAVMSTGDLVLWHDLEHLTGLLRRLAVLSSPR